MREKSEYYVINSSEKHLAAQMFNPERLVLARQLNGITKSKLAKDIGKTPGAITQFENGVKPNLATIYQLTLALGVPLSFFTVRSGISPINGDECHYRRLSSATKKYRNQLQAKGTLIQELIVYLGQFVEWQKEQISDLSRSVHSNDDIENLALEVREKWGLGIGPISNLSLLLENKGIILVDIPPEAEGVDAFSTWSNNIPMAFLASDRDSASRMRFSLGHEFGHLIMHADVKAGDKPLERQADRFSGAFLFPREAFVREFPKRMNFQVLFDLKKRWKISVRALVRRAYDLQLVSESTYKRANIELNKRGFSRSEPFEPEKENPKLLKTIISSYCSHNNLMKDELAESMGISPTLLGNYF